MTETEPVQNISAASLRFIDELIDGVTLAANHPNFADVATIIGTAKREIADALIAAGGTPLAVQRTNEGR